MSDLITTADTMEEFSRSLNSMVGDIRSDSREIIRSVRTSVAASPFAASALADALSDACLLVDAYGVVISANKKATEVFGMIGDHVSLEDVVHAYNPDQDVSSGEWVLYKSNDVPEYFDVSLSDTPAGRILILRDVTYKKRLELKALDVSIFQQTLVRSIPAYVFYTDTSGGYIRGSDRFMELLGWNRRDALRRSIQDILPEPECAELVAGNLEATKVAIKTAEGVRYFTLRASRLHTDSGSIGGFICVLEA